MTVRPVAGQSLIGAATATRWQDDLVAEGGEVVAEYADGYLAGQPAVLDNSLGAGRAVYLGTRLDQDSFETLVRGVLDRAGVRPVHAAPAGVEVAERRTGDRAFLFLLNHGDGEAALRLDRRGTDLLTGRVLDAGDELILEPAGVAVVESGLRGGSRPLGRREENADGAYDGGAAGGEGGVGGGLRGQGGDL